MAQGMRAWAAAIMVIGLWGLVPGAHAQPARARATAGVDLDARLAEAQANPSLAQALRNNGRKVSAICANCHGEGGNSTHIDTPNLAGQNPAYLLEQMRQFADGRRKNEFMQGLIRVMDADEKVAMVLFYADQKVAPRPITNPALAARGQEYYDRICFRCHGTDGRGNAQIARIAGQQPEYLHRTLKRYQSNSDVRVNALMYANTRLMTDADIDAVVAFVAGMK